MTSEDVGPRTSAGVWLGLGLGGFFDGIVLHQLLQWHHMASSWRPTDDLAGLELNTALDGAFHAATYVFVVIGIAALWRAARRGGGRWSTRKLMGGVLIGFGSFNLVEGLINHQLLGLHHVNETAPPNQWLYWDLGFLIWGAVMLVAGAALVRRARQAP